MKALRVHVLAALVPALGACHLAVVAVALSAHAPYSQGALLASADTHARARRLGCLEIAPTQTTTDTPALPATHPVFEFAFGNGCERSIVLDLRRVRAWARWDAAGPDAPLALHDPRHEVHAVPLDARTRGVEVLAFDPPDDPSAPARPPWRVCLALDGTNDDARDVHVAPVCFEPGDGRLASAAPGAP